MDKDTTKSTINKVFAAFPLEKFQRIVAKAGCDRYVKKLKTVKLLYLMIITQFCAFESLRDIAGRVASDEQLQKVLHLTSISAATLSRRLQKIDHRVWELTFNAVKRTVWPQDLTAHTAGSYRLNIIDSSTVTLCLKRYLWADYRHTKSGIKLHQRLVVHDGRIYPDSAVLTTARRADKTVMDELVVAAKDALNVFDRGYVDYARWDEYCKQGIRFVSRLKCNATVYVREVKSLAAKQGLTEQIVLLGNPYTTQMTHPVRLLETRDIHGSPVVIVTNDLTLPAAQISDIYRKRWQIELFFKWVKQHLMVKRFYGTSPNAVYGQIWLALISYCLLQNVCWELPGRHTLLETLRAVRTFMYQTYGALVAALSRAPARTSRGRRRLVSCETVYAQLVDEIRWRGTRWLDITDRGMYL